MNTKVDERVFNAAKLLLANNPRKTVSEVMGLSVPTVDRIKAAKDYNEYKESTKIRSHKNEKKEAPAEKNQTIIYKPTWEMMQEMQKTNEILKGISSKLAFIVEELCGVPKKEG